MAAETKKATVRKARKTKPRNKALVVVESPAKARTIERYLGKNYIVRASMGHLRDLPKSQFGIDVDNDFAPKYINIRGKGPIIKELKKDAQKASRVYLASDPDREGEAIAWHLAYILGIDPNTDCRIVFNEITKPAIKAAIKEPHSINIDRVDAQQARRMLDRIVGYKLSPLLWRKVRKGLSAGRVQSVTVKMICEREREIQAFESVEYWTIDAKFRKGRTQYKAELVEIDGEKPSISNKTSADSIVSELSQQAFVVKDIRKSSRKRKPSAPFTTSSMQQDAARKLGFTSRRTMSIAQQLYEGIELGRSGPVGLITYMRTDSTRISALALGEARQYIESEFGTEYLPDKANIYAASKQAQDAHEAIRPTSAELVPSKIEKYLTKEQFKLYRLIWQRFIASHMKPAVYDTMTVSIVAGSRYVLRARGSRQVFPGFMKVYAGPEKKEKDVLLPELSEGEQLSLSNLDPEQHFTEPPPRYNDASLVKTLEEKDIGRPSTYAPIIETIIHRGYVVRRDKHFQPTELGFIVTELLEKHFKDIVDEKFTAGLENELDEVAEGKVNKNDLLREFYKPFSETLEKADEAIGHVELPVEVSDVKCELCGRMMVVKQGRYGKFLACPGFPECRNTKPLLVDTGVKCPKCGGSIVERKSRRGRVFYGCANYPKCDYVTWDQPQKEKCPKCGAFMMKHRYKNGRAILYCSNDDCETRVNHPINKELEKMRKKQAEKKAAAAEDKNLKPEDNE
ncbi:MAG: type I DNA topoisomerase [Veillonellaceae bacterium]|nr:type I DNA topoisomerase [Veillonellaceae bacterium]